jgi:hypothetical protein
LAFQQSYTSSLSIEEAHGQIFWLTAMKVGHGVAWALPRIRANFERFALLRARSLV